MANPTFEPVRTEPKERWGVLVLCLATLLAYAPILHAGFVWDDDNLLFHNPLIRASGGLYRLWFSAQGADYWPVTYSTLWIEWRLWGMNPLGYHVTNLALHLTEALMLGSILRRLQLPGAWLAAFLFALHPVNVESVAWIAQRKNLMAMFFFLLSVWWFLDERKRGYGLSLAAFVMAMLSKGSVAMAPFAFLGLIAWRRKVGWRDLARLAPYFAVAVVLTAADVWFQKHGTAEVFRSEGFLVRLTGAGMAVWFYLAKALWPFRLAFVYPAWSIDPRYWADWFPIFAAFRFTLSLLIWRGTAARAALFAWGYFCLMLVPVMGFVDVYFMKYSLVANHYEHLALIGIVGSAAAGWSEWERKSPGFWPTAAAYAVLVLFGVQTYRQTATFVSSSRLFAATLRVNPDSAMAHNALGALLFPTGQREEAIRHFQTSLRLDPDNAEAHFNLGYAESQVGQTDEAVSQYRQALQDRPRYFDARLALANALADTGDLDEAIGNYAMAVELNPNSFAAQANLGKALAKTGRNAAAVPHFEKALALSPGNAGIRISLDLARARSAR